MHSLHFSAAGKDFSSLFSSFSFLSIASLSVPIRGRAPIGRHKTELSSYWSPPNWDSQRDAQFGGFAKWYQQMALTAAEMVVQPPLAFNGVFLGVLVAAAMKIYLKWSLDVHRRATNASHWQLVSRKAFYLAITFSAAALKGSPHSCQNLRRAGLSTSLMSVSMIE